MQALDPQMIDDPPLGVNHVLDRDDRVPRPVWPPRPGIDAARRGGAKTGTGDIHTDDEVLREIDAFPVAYQAVPPPCLLVARIVLARDMRARRKSMADENGVRSLIVQFADRK